MPLIDLFFSEEPPKKEKKGAIVARTIKSNTNIPDLNKAARIRNQPVKEKRASRRRATTQY